MAATSLFRLVVLPLTLQCLLLVPQSTKVVAQQQQQQEHVVEDDFDQDLDQIPDLIEDIPKRIVQFLQTQKDPETVRENMRHLAAASLGLSRTLQPANLQQAWLKSRQNVSGTSAEGLMVNRSKTLLGDGLKGFAECEKDSDAFFNGFLGEPQTVWALQMFDSWGKMMPGIVQGATKWPGAYDECYEVFANNSELEYPPYSAQYCTATLTLAEVPPSLPVNKLQFGVCIPNTCTNRDFAKILTEMLQSLGSSDKVALSCRQRMSYILGSQAILAVVILSLFLVCLILGTTLDIVLLQWPKWQEEKIASSDISTNAQSLSLDASLPLLGKKSAVRKKPVELGFLGKFFLAFSVWTNGAKLLSTKQPPGSLTCIHGIRFLSMTWVVLGHCFSGTQSQASNLLTVKETIASRWTFQAVSNATVSVDSFFVMSGLLVTYLTLREMNKKSTWKINWYMFYFHRFWRLTPVYMIMIMITVCIIPYVGDGPNWPGLNTGTVTNCKKNWWTNLLYINNLVNSDQKCLGVSWYLANDMQFYVLSPLIIVPFFLSPVWGSIMSAAFILGTSIPTGVIEMEEKFSPGGGAVIEGNPVVTENSNTMYYIKPWHRMGPYVIGIMAGYLLYRCKGKLYINRYLNLLIWGVATGAAVAVLYGLYDASTGGTMTLESAALYMSVHRQVWGACVAWVVVACCTGNGGFVDTLMSWPALVPLSRLSYCIYLIHSTLISIYGGISRVPFYISDVSLVSFFIAILVYSYILGFAASLAFEAPMMGLEKVLFHPAPKPQEAPGKEPPPKYSQHGLSNGAMNPAMTPATQKTAI